MPRPDGRAADELRPITFERDFTDDGARLGARVVRPARACCAPRPSTRTCRGGCGAAARVGSPPSTRCSPVRRPSASSARRHAASVSGRTQEIQRLIGRSLRAVTDMRLLGERQVIVDCDVLQADGGTRTASICGGYLALHDARQPARAAGTIKKHPIIRALRRGLGRHRQWGGRCSTSPTSRTPRPRST